MDFFSLITLVDVIQLYLVVMLEYEITVDGIMFGSCSLIAEKGK